jgi:hypothetical protein
MKYWQKCAHIAESHAALAYNALKDAQRKLNIKKNKGKGK